MYFSFKNNIILINYLKILNKIKIDIAIAAEKANARARGESIEKENNDNDSTTSQTDRPDNLYREFLYDINPISRNDWKKSTLIMKIILVVRSPAMIILQLLIPVVNETAVKNGWSKLLNCLQLCVTPTVALFKLNGQKYF